MFCSLVILIVTSGKIFSQDNRIFSWTELVEDTRKLSEYLESAHPDPYINRGGKINFNRRLQKTLAGISKQGMSLRAFYNILLPFIASVGDGHTALINPKQVETVKPGISFVFRAIDKTLYVAEVYQKNHKKLLGAKLISVSGITLSELLVRQGNLRGYDNIYQNLTNLINNLNTFEGLVTLLPHWQGKGKLVLVLKHYRQKEIRVQLSMSGKLQDLSLRPESKLRMPATDRKDFNYRFMDAEKKTALLKIDSMMGYREAYEWFYAKGFPWTKNAAQKIYRRYHRTEPPEQIEKIIQGLPAVTDTFIALFEEMKQARSKTLLVDLRSNRGGNSALTQILLYFLWGKQKVLQSMNVAYDIKKYSLLFFENYTKVTMNKINLKAAVPLNKSDYDFRSEMEFFSPDIENQRSSVKEFLGVMPTFFEKYQKCQYEAYYQPENIIVLTSACTYSSGFTLAAFLYKNGVFLAGVPSAQAGNCFGDTLGFKLPNTGIEGYLSYKKSVMFPDDPKKGKLLSPHFELTYKKLASYKFDPNATIMLALDMLASKNRSRNLD